MNRLAAFAVLLFGFPLVTTAGICEKYWLHVGGLSKHIEVYEPTHTTRYRRQSHPGLGIECKARHFTVSSGEFTNSVDRPMTYSGVSKSLYSLGKVSLYGGLIAGEYGRRYKDPLRLILPSAYLEYTKAFFGMNLFVLPPAQGWNDYVVVFAQFKLGL